MTKRLQKTNAIAVCLVAAFALSACGGGAEDADDEARSASAPRAAAPADDATETAEDEVEEATDKVANVTDEAGDDMDDMDNSMDAVADGADDMEATPAAAQGGEGGAEYASLTGDATAGRRVFAKCMACHTVQEGQNRVGPSLYDIVGREAGSIEGFNYSDANANSGITWTEEVMFEYLEAPQEYIPGTRMIFPGLPAAQDRADVIAYLKSAAE